MELGVFQMLCIIARDINTYAISQSSFFSEWLTNRQNIFIFSIHVCTTKKPIIIFYCKELKSSKTGK